MSKEVNNRPSLIKKRSYKYFDRENFLLEVRNTDFSKVINSLDVDEASNIFAKLFRRILENHAPIKVFQTRKNYAPWLSDSTKEEIKMHNILRLESMANSNPDILKQYKTMRN